jgi:hypothetical protein
LMIASSLLSATRIRQIYYALAAMKQGKPVAQVVIRRPSR